MAGVVASETVRAQTLQVLRLRLSLRSRKGKKSSWSVADLFRRYQSDEKKP